MSMPSTAGRSARSYSTVDALTAAGDRNSERGNFVLKPGAAQYWRPSFQQGAVTTLRILPTPSPENPSVLEPYRTAQKTNHFGDWVRYYPAARNFGVGNDKTTFIISTPTGEAAELAMSPAHVLYNAVDRAVSAKQDRGWGGFLKGAAGRSADLPKPEGIYLTQVAVLATGQKMFQPWKGSGGNERAIVFEWTSGLGKSILESLNKPKDGYNGDPGNYEESMDAGDPVSLNHGRFLTIFRKADGNPRTRAMQMQAGPVSAFGGPAGGLPDSSPQGRDAIGYDFIWEPSFMGTVPPQLTGMDAYVLQRTQLWDDIVHLPTFEEQAALLAPRFPGDMLMYAWRDHPEWITEDIRRRAAAATSVQMPGMPAMGMPGMGVPGMMPGMPAMGVPGMMPGMGMPGMGVPGAMPGYPQPQEQYQQPAGYGGFGGGMPAVAPNTTAPAFGGGGIPNTTAPAALLPGQPDPHAQQAMGPHPGMVVAQNDPAVVGFGGAMAMGGFGGGGIPAGLGQQPQMQPGVQQPLPGMGGFGGQLPMGQVVQPTTFQPTVDASIPSGSIPSGVGAAAPGMMPPPPVQPMPFGNVQPSPAMQMQPPVQQASPVQMQQPVQPTQPVQPVTPPATAPGADALSQARALLQRR